MATRQSYSNRSQQNTKLINMQDPSSPQDGATKAYVDAAANGLQAGKAGKYAMTLPAISKSSTYTFTHGLGTIDIIMNIYNISDHMAAKVDMGYGTANTAWVSPSVDIPANTVRIVVIG